MLEILAAATGGLFIGFVGGVSYFFALAKGNHLTSVEPRIPTCYPYRHRKRGSRYGIVGRVRAQCSTRPIEDGEMLILYREMLTGAYSARPYGEFHDGRFELLAFEEAYK